jgi:hypothetical protein
VHERSIDHCAARHFNRRKLLIVTQSTLTRVLTAVVIPLGVAVSAAAAASNLVVNGGFETGDFTGWQLGGNTAFHSVAGGSIAQSGSYGMLTGPAELLGSISQTLTTVPGRTYQVEYWLANYDAGPNEFNVTWNGQKVGQALKDTPAFGYRRFIVNDLVATTTSTTLSFEFRHDPSFWNFDSVSVVAVEIAADVAILTATTPDSKRVDFTYSVSDASVGPVNVGVYRSADETFDAATDLLIASTTITDPTAGSGSVAANLALDPARPFVLVVADPANAIQEVDETNNAAAFRKQVVGVVTSGFQLVGNLPVVEAVPAWVGDMARVMEQRGYSKIVTVDWSALNNTVSPGQTTIAAQLVANELRRVVAEMNLLPGDVIDTHWIGHSRGAVVNSEALELLTRSDLLPAAAKNGWTKMTMLDPHPAKNGPTGPLCSFDRESQIGWLLFNACAAFQAIAQDPDARFPDAVAESEVYFQQTSHLNAPSWERFINLWGVSDILPTSHNWTHDGIGHAEIPEAYRIGELETFDASAVASNTASLSSATAVLGASTDEIEQFFPDFVSYRGVAQSLLAKLAAARAAIAQGNVAAGSGPLHAFIAEVEAQRSIHIQPEVADLLVAAARRVISALE